MKHDALGMRKGSYQQSEAGITTRGQDQHVGVDAQVFRGQRIGFVENWICQYVDRIDSTQSGGMEFGGFGVQ